MFDRYWSGRPLLPKDINPAGYNGESIDLLHYFLASISFSTRSTEGKVYVAKDGPPILGWIQQYDLHIVVNPRAPSQVMIVEDDSLEEILSNAMPVFRDKIGLLKGYAHQIILSRNATPVQHKLRKVPLIIKDEVKVLIKDMLDTGIIEPVEASEWVSPVVILKKADGKLRFCVDLRSLNNCVVADVFPLPNINELLSTLGGARYFSKLDLRSAYHQIRLHDSSKHLTAFITSEGAFQFTRLPFGLCSAANVFQRMVTNIFKGIGKAIYFQDDILVFVSTLAEHNQVRKTVLHRISEVGLTLCRDKCSFVVEQIEYLGHEISAEGIKPKRDLLKAIELAPAPIDKDQLRSFMGLIEYYSKFLQLFSDKTACLRDLFKKKRCKICLDTAALRVL